MSSGREASSEAERRPETLIHVDRRRGAAIRLRITRDGVVLLKRVVMGRGGAWRELGGNLVLYRVDDLRILARAFHEIAEAEERR